MIYYFTISLLGMAIAKKIIGNFFAIDEPDYRKHHNEATPQIGGLVFGLLFLIVIYNLKLVSNWYIICGLITILLGIFDDLWHIPWKIKIVVQLALALYIASIFWGKFETITFYNYSFNLNVYVLLFIYLIWFIGIYNAVNLLDGLDGLAGGYMLLISFAISLFGNPTLNEMHLIFASILIGFLVFNQRSAKLFMGDAGSLFLGFHMAVLPLLSIDEIQLNSTRVLDMTPYILLGTYLIADTTRVFFTRIVDKKNPMTADTIHFHHLVLQESGSYITSIFSIYFITSITLIISIISINYSLATNAMLLHFAFLLFFILTPPVETYVPFLTKIIKPFYNWQKNDNIIKPSLPRTIFVFILFIFMIASILYHSNINVLLSNRNLLSLLILLLIINYYRKEKITIYIIQVGLVFLLSNQLLNIQLLGILPKIFSTLIFVSYIIFTFEKRRGCIINQFSALDILLIVIMIAGFFITMIDVNISFWSFFIISSIWFSVSFLLRRTYYI